MALIWREFAILPCCIYILVQARLFEFKPPPVLLLLRTATVYFGGPTAASPSRQWHPFARPLQPSKSVSSSSPPAWCTSRGHPRSVAQSPPSISCGRPDGRVVALQPPAPRRGAQRKDTHTHAGRFRAFLRRRLPRAAHRRARGATHRPRAPASRLADGPRAVETARCRANTQVVAKGLCVRAWGNLHAREHEAPERFIGWSPRETRAVRGVARTLDAAHVHGALDAVVRGVLP